MTQTAFLEALRVELMARYDWTKDAAKLARFMSSAEHTIAGNDWTWNHDGEAATAAWRTIGGKGKPTMKGLRALPKGV